MSDTPFVDVRAFMHHNDPPLESVEVIAADYARTLERDFTKTKAELAALHTELELLTHKLITCGVAASHPDANLAHTKAYAQQWNSPQAEDVRILRADRAALRAECERLKEDAERYRWLCDEAYIWGDSKIYGEDVQIEPAALWILGSSDLTKPQIDAAIDAARKDQP